MNAEELVWQYLTTHKTPVLAETLAKRFLISKSHARGLLRSLAEANKVDVISVGSRKFYKIKLEWS